MEGSETKRIADQSKTFVDFDRGEGDPTLNPAIVASDRFSKRIHPLLSV